MVGSENNQYRALTEKRSGAMTRGRCTFQDLPPLRASVLARQYGFTSRYWIKLAAAGRIPGARQPFGPGGVWLFDAEQFGKWWKTTQREVRAWPGYTGEGGYIGAAPSVKIESTGEASRQRTERLLRNVLGRGSTNSTRFPGATSPGGPTSRRKRSSFAST
jgi:hypothetical protein